MTKSLARKLALGLALSVLAVGTAGVAQADDWHHDRDRDWREHEVRAYHYWHPRPHVIVEPEPTMVYAPPVVMAPPPPPEPMGINLILPLHFN